MIRQISFLKGIVASDYCVSRDAMKRCCIVLGSIDWSIDRSIGAFSLDWCMYDDPAKAKRLPGKLRKQPQGVLCLWGKGERLHIQTGHHHGVSGDAMNGCSVVLGSILGSSSYEYKALPLPTRPGREAMQFSVIRSGYDPENASDFIYHPLPQHNCIHWW